MSQPDPTISLGREDGTWVVATLSGYLPLIDAAEAAVREAEKLQGQGAVPAALWAALRELRGAVALAVVPT